MNKKSDEENETKKHKSTVITPDWLDLPEPIAINIIIEHLEIVDYIRFSAVCKKWQSIQKEHRVMYSPYAPPLSLTFPWLYCCSLQTENVGGRNIGFYLPDKQKSYNMPLCRTPKKAYIWDYKHGWFLLLNGDGSNCWFSFFNPITSVQIKLPPLMRDGFCHTCTTNISSPPTDPNYTILLMYSDGESHLCRLNDNSGWKLVDCLKIKQRDTVLFNNKVYAIEEFVGIIYVVDTILPDSFPQKIEMDYFGIFGHATAFSWKFVNLHEELIMIIIVYEHYIRGTLKEFHAYRADFSINRWVKTESLYDHALFFSVNDNIFSVPASDVGCKKNTIYSTDGFKNRKVAWRAYDLGTKDWIDGPYMSLSSKKYSWSWFLPTLEYPNVAKTNGAS